MFVFTFDKKKGAKIAFISLFSLIALMLCAFVGFQQKDGVKAYATCDELGTYSTEAPDEEAQVQFLRALGLRVEKKPLGSDEITIPTVFDSVYNEYNDLQSELGLDLSMFKGQEVERVVFRLKNSNRSATLLVYKGHVIGGHIGSGVYGNSYESLLSSRKKDKRKQNGQT